MFSQVVKLAVPESNVSDVDKDIWRVFLNWMRLLFTVTSKHIGIMIELPQTLEKTLDMLLTLGSQGLEEGH